MGKSALCNLLSGHQQQDPEAFKVAPYFYQDRTQKSDVRNAKWMGKGQEFLLVDTPGTCKIILPQLHAPIKAKKYQLCFT